MKNSFSKKSILVLIAMLCIQTNNSSAAFDDETPQPQDNDHHIQHNKPNIHDITGAQGLLDMPDYPRDQFCKNLTLPQLAVVTTLYCVTVPFLFSIPVWLAHTAVEALTKS